MSQGRGLVVVKQDVDLGSARLRYWPLLPQERWRLNRFKQGLLVQFGCCSWAAVMVLQALLFSQESSLAPLSPSGAGGSVTCLGGELNLILAFLVEGLQFFPGRSGTHC